MCLPEGGAAFWAWFSIVYLGLGVSFGACSLYGFSISRMPAAQAGMFMNLIPVFTLVFSMIILGETPTLVQRMASAPVPGGVIISRRNERGGPGLPDGAFRGLPGQSRHLGRRGRLFSCQRILAGGPEIGMPDDAAALRPARRPEIPAAEREKPQPAG